jgi:N4-gp56 family major capsid protein
MAIAYASTPQSFIDSAYGTAAATTAIQTLVNKVIDRKYHKQAQSKCFWQNSGMIGPDLYAEGDYAETKPGYPVIRKTELQSNPGDTIRMGLQTNLAVTHSIGKVGPVQLVDAEVGWNYYHLDIKIEEWRQAVRTDGGMNVQRNPYKPLEEQEADLLSDWEAQTHDNEITYALWCGRDIHTLRNLGTASLLASPNLNTLFGNDITMDTTKTIADMKGDKTSNISALTFEIAKTYMTQNNFDPIPINGGNYFVALISPMAELVLLQDERFRNAQLLAAARGPENPLFKHASFLYNNVIILTYDKIRSLLGGNNPTIAVTGGTIGSGDHTVTISAYTGIGGGLAYTDLHQTQFLGANAVCLAEGATKMGVRTEDDYKHIIGRSTSSIYGVARADWRNETVTNATAPTSNQSSLTIVNSLVM